ncbi:hypothetical protein C0J52_01680 [Blattella germanica]|nr:hypothetical protein C0J52_01680 [Blattella germanica]
MTTKQEDKSTQPAMRQHTLLGTFALILIKLWICTHAVLDGIIDFIFSLIYDDSKRAQIPPVEDSLLMESAVSLAEKIRNKEVTAETVVLKFIKRIQEVNPIINCVVDERYEIAEIEAKDVDIYLSTTFLTPEQLKIKKPFLGVPFTTKDSTACKGMLHTLGLLSRRNFKATEDAEVVNQMKEAGAILIATTNIPEVNMWCETRNNVFGMTLNPYNTTRTVGGSSGGESSLIAVAGSPLGLGTDIGGSIRMPAFYCGIFGHKPTTGLISTKGLTRRTGLEKHTMVSAGPMCKYAQDLTPFLQVLLGDNISKFQLDSEVNLKDLQFFYMEKTGDLRASTVCEEMQNSLQKAVSHFNEISKMPVQKVSFSDMRYSFKLWRYWMTQEPAIFPYELGNREETISVWKEFPKKLLGLSDFTLAAILRLADGVLPQEKAEWAETTTKRLKDEIVVVAAPYNDHLCIAVAKELQKAFGGWVPPFPV